MAMASNNLLLSYASGTPLTEVEIIVDLDNSDAIVALEMVLPLGEHLKYIDNSAVLAEARSNGHQISAGQVGQELRVYIYSLSLNALQGNMGELMRFRLQLGNEPIDFTLSPTIVLSNAQGKPVSCSVQKGKVTIKAPKLEISQPQIDFGHIPIHSTYTQYLQLKNVGTSPLTITNITSSHPELMSQETSMTLQARSSTSVAIQYTPTEHGAISEKVVVYSNAPNGNQEVTIVADPYSVNELQIGNASGIANEEVSISLSMNNMAPIVAVQCSIALPEQLEYVPNSIMPNSVRSSEHQALSTIKKYVPKPDQWDEFPSDTLVLMLYSLTNQVFKSNKGEIARFKLRLTGNTGSYALRPHDVALLTATTGNMLSAAYEGSVNIKSPSFNGDDHLSFGDNSIIDPIVAEYMVRNYGNAPLRVERVNFLDEGYQVLSPLPMQVKEWEASVVRVAYTPKEEGDFTSTMNIYTNDPENQLKSVAISGHTYAPNSLSLDGKRTPEGNYQLSVSMNNYSDIVAMQYDIHWRSDMTTSQTAFVPTDRLQNHNATVVQVNANTYRVLIYSMNNAPIIGNEGEVHQLVFAPQGEVNYCYDLVAIENIILSNANSINKATQPVSYHVTLEATTESETLTLCASELPYQWYGQQLTEQGNYVHGEPYKGTKCDSLIHELTLNVYTQTLPSRITLPTVRVGKSIDLTIQNREIKKHISKETWYAPNAKVQWYVMQGTDWITLTDEPVAEGVKEVVLKYVVETDCGIVESDNIVIVVTTDLEHIQSTTQNIYKIIRDNKIFIIRNDKMYSIMGQEVRK